MKQITDMVSMKKEGDIAVIVIDNPPVNALSAGVRTGLYEAVTQADADDTVKAILIMCTGRTYIAGADIKEFGKPAKGTSFFEVLTAIENASKPVVSSIHGTAFGGGLETALVCHYRVAVASAKFGLPEVKLGILPGAGGTQRLPRVVGVSQALTMMVSGDPVGADFALETGLINAIVDDVEEGGLAFAREILTENRPLVKVRDSNEKLEEAKSDPDLFANFRKSITRKIRGFAAPEAIIQCVEDAVNKPFDESIKCERERFQQLLSGPQASAQQYYFFAERQANKIPASPRTLNKSPSSP